MGTGANRLWRVDFRDGSKRTFRADTWGEAHEKAKRAYSITPKTKMYFEREFSGLVLVDEVKKNPRASTAKKRSLKKTPKVIKRRKRAITKTATRRVRLKKAVARAQTKLKRAASSGRVRKVSRAVKNPVRWIIRGENARRSHPDYYWTGTKFSTHIGAAKRFMTLPLARTAGLAMQNKLPDQIAALWFERG